MSGGFSVVRARRRLLCVLATTIVAAFEGRPFAAVAISEDVPVPGGAAAFARALAIDPPPDRARFMSEVGRILYDQPEPRNPAVAAYVQSLRQGAKNRRAPESGTRQPPELVPVPLTADVWDDAVFHRRVAREDLVAAIVADRSAALLCHGLAALDDPTLAYLGEHPAIVARVYERVAPVFAAFSESLRIRDGRVVPAGGGDAVPLWETAVGEKVTRPEKFILALYESGDGRLAYLYDTIARIDAPRRAFALGLWMNPTDRQDRFKLVTDSLNAAIREWHVRALPFGRASYDLPMALARIAVTPSGEPAPPRDLALWSRVAGGPEIGPDGSIDAAWLIDVVVASDVRQRSERLDQIAFAQRVFADATASDADAAFVLRALPKHRALLLALERMGVRGASTYAAALKSVARLAALDARRGFIAQAQLQGALAVLARMSAVGTLDGPSTDRLLRSLLAVPLTEDGRYAGAIGRWIAKDLRPLLPAARDVDASVVSGLAGPALDPAAMRRVTWEGEHYRLDYAGSERRRLERVRERQEAVPLDVPLQLFDAAGVLAPTSAAPTADDIEATATQLTAIAADLPLRSREEEADYTPAGVPVASPAHDVLRKAVEDLTRIGRGRDLKRATRVAEPLVEVADELLARALLSLTYAIHIGDPDGTVLLAHDVSHRHDFGFSLKDGEFRSRVVWAVPRQEVAPNTPWHVSGSLLGLDVALSSLALRRVSADHPLEAPKLTTNARESFATSVALLNPRALRDEDRDAIADHIERGRRRLLSAADDAALDTLATEAAIEGARRRAMRWTRAHEPERLPLMVSLSELFVFGGGRAEDMQAWGMAVLPATGCFCTRMAEPGGWVAVSGRPQLGLIPSVLPDVNFRIAIALRQLGLPAGLAKIVLSGAMQDFIDEARPADDGDWLTLSRIARAIPIERIEDYIAAATASGPLVPDAIRTPER